MGGGVCKVINIMGTSETSLEEPGDVGRRGGRQEP